MATTSTSTRGMAVRRTAITVAGVAAALGLLGAPALAMQPAGGPAQERFGCVENGSDAVAGHPGAAGLVAATPMVRDLTGNPMPTAWNAVERAGPIGLGIC
ncbi:MAG: hypothetical protein ACNA8R_08505 [Nitriliruptoraceae bacterium]